MSKDSPIAESFNEKRRREKKVRKKNCWRCDVAKMRLYDGTWECHYCGHSEPEILSDSPEDSADE